MGSIISREGVRAAGVIMNERVFQFQRLLRHVCAMFDWLECQSGLMSHLPPSFESLHSFEDFDPSTHAGHKILELRNISVLQALVNSVPFNKGLSVSVKSPVTQQNV